MAIQINGLLKNRASDDNDKLFPNVDGSYGPYGSKTEGITGVLAWLGVTASEVPKGITFGVENADGTFDEYQYVKGTTFSAENCEKKNSAADVTPGTPQEIEDGSITRNKLSADVKSSLSKADSALQSIVAKSITKAMLSEEVQASLGKADSALQSIVAKSITKAMLSEEVQASLNKANSALQEHQSLSGYATRDYVEDLVTTAQFGGSSDVLLATTVGRIVNLPIDDQFRFTLPLDIEVGDKIKLVMGYSDAAIEEANHTNGGVLPDIGVITYHFANGETLQPNVWNAIGSGNPNALGSPEVIVDAENCATAENEYYVMTGLKVKVYLKKVAFNN